MSYAYAERLLTDDETRQLVEYQRQFDKDLVHRAEVLAVRILMRSEIRPRVVGMTDFNGIFGVDSP
jgi:hypothetical protein